MMEEAITDLANIFAVAENFSAVSFVALPVKALPK
jgi:hypothetical protein